MSKDISRILDGWDFTPDEIAVRVIRGDDGQEKIQLRIDLGLMQMEMSGRPDGLRPEGFESWLEYYQERQTRHEARHPDTAFVLDEQAGARLWREAVQYYHRYFSLWHLERYSQCTRDTERNLRAFAFVRAHARDDRMKLQFDQFRPYVLMMHARSVATPLVAGGRFGAALQAIEQGIDAVRDFLEEYGQTERAEECAELVSLERWREEVLLEESKSGAGRPESLLDVLRRRLLEAVAAERFEEAAQLRDEIRRLSESAT